MIYPARHISVSIDRPQHFVYEFAANPINLPAWIAFINSIQKVGEAWRAQTDQGNITLQFVATNHFGVMDHMVTLADGKRVQNTMRITSNGTGAEVIFTLLHLPERTPYDFELDARAVELDLQTLKTIMEERDLA